MPYGLAQRTIAQRRLLITHMRDILRMLNDINDYENALTGQNSVIYRSKMMKEEKLKRSDEIIRILRTHPELEMLCGFNKKG